MGNTTYLNCSFLDNSRPPSVVKSQIANVFQQELQLKQQLRKTCSCEKMESTSTGIVPRDHSLLDSGDTYQSPIHPIHSTQKKQKQKKHPSHSKNSHVIYRKWWLKQKDHNKNTRIFFIHAWSITTPGTPRVLFFLKATLPLKPATVALKIVHQRLSRRFCSPWTRWCFFVFFKRRKAIHLRQERGLSDAENSGWNQLKAMCLQVF